MYTSKWSLIEFHVDGSYYLENAAICEVFYQVNGYNRFRNLEIFHLNNRDPHRYVINVLKNDSFSYRKSRLGKDYWYKIN